MGVCCIVFDIDGMLFEFFMNFLNIEKNKILRIFFSIFHVFIAFHAISSIIKKIGVKKKIPGGGVWIFFLEKQLFLISRFMLFSTLKKKYILKSAPSLVKWDVVSPNSREGQLESISINILYSFVEFCILNVGGGV